MPDVSDWVAKQKEKGYSEEQIIAILSKKGYTKQQIDGVMAKKTNKEGDFSFLDKVKYLFTSPNTFFEKLESEKSIKNSVITYVIALLVTFVASFAWSMLSISGMYYGGYYGYGYIGSVSLIISVVGMLIEVGLSHLLIKAFKGQGNFVRTFQVMTYSLVPFMVISLIPFIGWISIIYSFVLIVIGFSKLHRISKGMSALALFLPIIFILGLFLIFIIYLLSSWGF